MIPGLHLTLGGRLPTTIAPYCGQLTLSGSVVTVGSFDGVHRGHQALLNHVVSRARTVGVAPVVYTFSPPPKAAFGLALQLTTLDEKLRRLSHFGVDFVLVAHFTSEFASRTAGHFIDELGKLNPKEIWVGGDFRFGKDRAGDIGTIGRYFDVHVLDEVVCAKGSRISSTRLRDLLAQGRYAEAAELHGWDDNWPRTGDGSCGSHDIDG
jgi:riboflavin kinase / FMN adenylyltransferase